MSRKNHKMIDGRLLQMDKKYSHLKMKQKEKINLWINEEIKAYYKRNGSFPRQPEPFIEVLDRLYARIEKVGIWIPYDEIYSHYFGKRHSRIDKVEGQIRKEERSLAKAQIIIEPLSSDFAVCKVYDYSHINPESMFCFPQKTDEENSLVCLSSQIPPNTTDLQDGWRAFRIKGQMEFSLIGILAGIAAVLANKAISIYAISTFNTDYVLVDKEDFEKAIDALRSAGYTIVDSKKT